MAPKRVELNPFLLSLAAVLSLETIIAVAGRRISLDPCFLIGIVRILETGAIWYIFRRLNNSADGLGLAPATLRPGIYHGLLWTAGIGVSVMFVFGICLIIDVDPLATIRMRLPMIPGKLFCFFVVGGIISPVAEELFFRGVIFGYMRRWGFWLALIISTAGFIIAHSSSARLPLNQAVGGILFGVAYEKTGMLTVPIIIHIIGNLSIFSISVVMGAP